MRFTFLLQSVTTIAIYLIVLLQFKLSLKSQQQGANVHHNLSVAGTTMTTALPSIT